MLSFEIHSQDGQPIYLQIVNSVKKSISAGELVAGQKLPSVREIAREIKVNPNTVHKAINLLVEERLLTTKRGLGCFVRKRRPSSITERLQALEPLIDHLIVEAAHHGLNDLELLKLIGSRQKRIYGLKR
ncbi:GntR family transcriptional regulator [Luteolibacter sp. AS25]|uniref:GntR family transcriptional regulator n=1 Tax=Luteolibacter sp. AS25 TaxID=3135776 RepID=UPI00398A6FE6